MSPYKNVPSFTLSLWRDAADLERRALSWVYAESDRLSGEAQHELGKARRSVAERLAAIDAELAIRSRMLPSTPVDIDVFDLATVPAN